MSKFGDAFKRGQEAYENAERNRVEIKNVFNELSNDIKLQTDGHVSLEFEKRAYTGLPGVTMPAGFLSMISGSEPYDALMAIPEGQKSNFVELCSVKFDPRGYPVTIAFPGESITVYDRESLETALVKMVEHPDVAAKLKRVLKVAVSPLGSEQAALSPALGEDTTNSNE